MRSAVEHQRRQVGLREVAVVVRLLLAPHRTRDAGRGVEGARLLHHLLARLDAADLTLDLVVDRLGEVAERVEVLDLDLGAQLLSSGRTHRHVGVAAQAALFHVAVAGAGVEQHPMEGLQVVLRLGRRPQIGRRHDLDQRDAAAVEVDQALSRQRAAARRFVQQLAGVLLEVQAMEGDALGVIGERQLAARGDRLLELRDLVALGQVGVEVVLARERRLRVEAAAECEREAGGEVDRLAIEHRQAARIAGAHRAGERVGPGAEPIGATAEDLGLRLEMDVDLESHHRFVLHLR